MSMVRPAPRSFAGSALPSGKMTVTSKASSTTCRFVTISPDGSMMKPDPKASTRRGVALVRCVGHIGGHLVRGNVHHRLQHLGNPMGAAERQPVPQRLGGAVRRHTASSRMPGRRPQ